MIPCFLSRKWLFTAVQGINCLIISIHESSIKGLGSKGLLSGTERTLISGQAINYVYATCVCSTVDFKIFSDFIIVCFADVVSLIIFPYKNEGSKQKIINVMGKLMERSNGPTLLKT